MIILIFLNRWRKNTRYNTLGELLKTLREDKTFTLRELSKRVNIPIATISRIENNKSVNYKPMIKLLLYYGLTLNQISTYIK